MVPFKAKCSPSRVCELMQEFYIYENWTRDWGRIHKAECSHCNEDGGLERPTPGETESGTDLTKIAL
jgi:hypothetical protein